MKKQKHPSPDLDESNFSNSMEENSIVEWLSSNARAIVLGISGILALLLVLVYVFSGNSSRAETDYYRAYQDFQAFQHSSGAVSGNSHKQLEALNNLDKILYSQPSLKAQYDASIVQILIDRNTPDLAIPYANAAFSRTERDNLPFYTDFAKNTLLISQENFSKALENSKALKQKMIENAIAAEKDNKEKAFGDALFAYNLLRIAFLEEKAGDPKDELKSWQEWKLYAGLAGKAPPIKIADNKVFFIIDNIFNDGEVSLADYINYREKLLSS